MSVPRTVGASSPVIPGRRASGFRGASNPDPCGGTFGHYVCSPSHCVCVCAAARSLRCWRFLSRFRRRGSPAGNGRITIINQRGARDRPLGISTIDRRGRFHVLKRCSPAQGSSCSLLESIDWAPDGRRLAFSVTTIGAISTYNGLHVLNTRTGRDRHLPRDGFDIDWSPDGSRFAYVEFTRFANPIGSIYMVRADGSGRMRLRTGSAGRDASPSWSPGGKRLVYETNAALEYSVRLRTASCGWSAWTARSASGREKGSRSCLVAQRPHDRLPRFLRDQAGYARGQGRDAADEGPVAVARSESLASRSGHPTAERSPSETGGVST